MQRVRRIGWLAHRAGCDAVEEVWHDVKFGVVAIALGTLAAAALGAPWEKIVLGNLIGVLGVPLAFFVYYLVTAIRQPDRHKSWKRSRTMVTPVASGKQAPGLLHLTIEPRKPTVSVRSRCEITDPDGVVWQELEAPISDSDETALLRRLYVYYPDSFPDAPPLREGTYEIRWLVGVGKKRWREVLRYQEMVKLP